MANATKTIHDYTEISSAASDDEHLIWDVSHSVTRRIAKANYLGGVMTGGGTIATGGHTLTIGGTSSINGNLSGAGLTLTVPATGTADLIGTAQTITALKTYSAGIRFNASHETLDYYRSGQSWTPVLADATSGGNVATAGTTFGRWWRIGPLCHVHGRLIDINTSGLTSGNAIAIRGLPFATANVTNYTPVGTVPILSNVTFSGTPTIYTGANSTYLRIWLSASGGAGGNMLVSALTSGTADITFDFEYEVA